MPLNPHIPGYDAALEQERDWREEAYLELPHLVCGHPLRQITPRLLAILFQLKTPFICGGELTEAHVAQFLWVCHLDYAKGEEARDEFAAKLVDLDFRQVEHEIDAFLDATFLDAPYGGKPGKSYVCNIAWLEYSMAKEPWRWTREKTLETPLRIIYQQLRCKTVENRGVLVNRKSDKVLDDMLNAQNDVLQGRN